MAEKDIDVGTVLGGYQIESILGKGGMGTVYKAHELSLNRKVALKILAQRLISDSEFIQRFKREAQVIAALEHPNIVRILSYGEEEGIYYYAMEYIRGKDLGQILKERSSIPLDEALVITAQVAGALSEADARGVVHRDLKPANIMIDEKGQVRITDFGVAYFQDTDVKLTRTGWFLGTPEFASPEQARGAPLDVRSDIYSLGVVLYWMLAGKLPFSGDSPQAVLIKIATESLPPIETLNPSVPASVRKLIEKMTAKELDQRFQKPADILAAIDDCTKKLEAPMFSPPPLPDKTEIPGAVSKPGTSPAKAVGIVLGVALAVLLVAWQSDALYQKIRPYLTSTKTAERLKVPAMEGVPSSGDVPAGPAQQTAASGQVPQQTIQPDQSASVRAHESSAQSETASVGPGKKAPPIREIPKVLIVVSGNESMTPLLRSNLEAIIHKSGLAVTRIAEIPKFMEKTQMGRMQISHYKIREIVPPDKADIILLAQVQKSGSTQLQYYGRTQEMTTATFTVEAVDTATGTSLDAAVAGTVNFTSLNMTANIKEAVRQTAGQVGQKIKTYWKKKQGGTKGSG